MISWAFRISAVQSILLRHPKWTIYTNNQQTKYIKFKKKKTKCKKSSSVRFLRIGKAHKYSGEENDVRLLHVYLRTQHQRTKSVAKERWNMNQPFDHSQFPVNIFRRKKTFDSFYHVRQWVTRLREAIPVSVFLSFRKILFKTSERQVVLKGTLHTCSTGVCIEIAMDLIWNANATKNGNQIYGVSVCYPNSRRIAPLNVPHDTIQYE